METELALAVSARSWVDVLHRFLADHGGARVRVTAMGPEELRREDFDVLLIDDSCSFLTPRLVHEVRRSGRAVVGVYDPDVFADGKQRLLECGVTDVVEADADPDEFLRVVGRVAVTVDRIEPTWVETPAPGAAGSGQGTILAVTGASGGAGASEVAVAIASALRGSNRSVVLVDGDEAAPSLAPRLGLPLHPNIRTAADAVAHRTAGLDKTLHTTGGLRVLTGSPKPVDEVRPRDLLEVIEAVREASTHVVVDLGCATGRAWAFGRLVSEVADRVVTVGSPSPVGIVRLVDWLAALASIRPEGRIDILVNRAPGESFRRGEIVEEITRTCVPASFAFLPDDPLVAKAGWDGLAVSRGPFTRSVRRWVGRFVGVA